MKPQTLSAGMLALGILLRPALTADDDALTRMALCKDSWVEWQKCDPAKMKAFVDGGPRSRLGWRECAVTGWRGRRR